MTPNLQAMWLDIAEAIEPYCKDGAQYIRYYYEDGKCLGFTLSNSEGKLCLHAHRAVDGFSRFPFEEGIPDDAC